MSYNRENFARIKKEYETKHLVAEEESERRKNLLYAALPELKKIDLMLGQTGVKIFSEAIKGKDNLDERISSLEKENKELLEKRAELLRKNGYPEDFTDVKYECPKCKDSGFVGIKMCDCFKKELVKAGFESSGLGALLKDQSFENFNTKYYGQYEKDMQLTFKKCLSYAESFGEHKENLLFMGGTGLGKTHLSTAVGKTVIEKGFDVVYDTVQNILCDFEDEQFRNAEDKTNKYFECDLLIIDDLGTEMQTQFTVSSLFRLINSRLNSGKCTIINTNLSQSELRKNYTDRLSSRLFGCFSPLLFKGNDIRLLKLRNN